jgi:hypothetical protein
LPGSIERQILLVNGLEPRSIRPTGFGISSAASVTYDVTGGIIDRFRRLDLVGSALLAAHVVASLARNGVSTVLVFAVAILIGFHAEAGTQNRRRPREASPRSHVICTARVLRLYDASDSAAA